IGAQGNAACFQVVANKNLDTFNRRVFIGQNALARPTAVGTRPQQIHASGNGTIDEAEGSERSDPSTAPALTWAGAVVHLTRVRNRHGTSAASSLVWTTLISRHSREFAVK